MRRARCDIVINCSGFCFGRPPAMIATSARGRPRSCHRTLGGNDCVCGSGGNDTILGGPAIDTHLAARTATTTFRARAKPTSYLGGARLRTPSTEASGDDFTASAKRVPTTSAGGTGNDTLDGGDDDDLLNGDDGDDTLPEATGTIRSMADGQRYLLSGQARSGTFSAVMTGTTHSSGAPRTTSSLVETAPIVSPAIPATTSSTAKPATTRSSTAAMAKTPSTAGRATTPPTAALASTSSAAAPTTTPSTAATETTSSTATTATTRSAAVPTTTRSTETRAPTTSSATPEPTSASTPPTWIRAARASPTRCSHRSRPSRTRARRSSAGSPLRKPAPSASIYTGRSAASGRPLTKGCCLACSMRHRAGSMISKTSAPRRTCKSGTYWSRSTFGACNRSMAPSRSTSSLRRKPSSTTAPSSGAKRTS